MRGELIRLEIVRRLSQMVREERLELSRPRTLEPKSSASTNSATPAISTLENGGYTGI